MRSRLALLVVAIALAAPVACSPPAADAAPVKVSGPIGYAGILGAGDTLRYTLNAQTVPGATSYRWTVTASATNGSWTGLLAAATTATPSTPFVPSSAGGWDSVTFTVTVSGVSANRSSKAPQPTTWRVYRYLPSTVATVDSSAVGPISLLMRSPSQDSIFTNGSAVHAHTLAGGLVQFCAFVRFGSGHVANIGAPTCDAVAAANFRSTRLAGFTAAESSWLSGACTPWSACLAGLGILRVRPDVLPTHRV